MATREITKPGPKYTEHLEQELMLEAEDTELQRGRMIARLGLLWRERRALLKWAAYGLLGSAIIAFLIPAQYTSTTRLMPPDQAGAGMASMLAALGKGGSELGMIGSELLGLRTSSDLFVGILRSRTMQDEIVNKFDLRKVYGNKQMGGARKTLDQRTDVSSDRKSGIITIRVSDRNAERAANIAREYAAELDRIVLTLNTSAAHRERAFLEQRLGQVQQDLETAEKEFGDFASKNTTIDVKEQGRAMIGAAAEVEGQLIAAQTELEGLRQIYTPNNVRVRSVQAKIDEYQRQLQKLGGKAESSGATSTTSTEDSYPSIRQLPILGIAYADLYRHAKVEEAIFETLTKQFEMAKVEEARETPSVKVLDEGDIPEGKSSPPRKLLTALGTFVALAWGAGWILARRRWQEVDPQHPGKVLAREVLGTIKEQTRRLQWRHKSDAIPRETSDLFPRTRPENSKSHE